jgi:hypothetical protein
MRCSSFGIDFLAIQQRSWAVKASWLTPASYLKNNLRVGRSALDDERVTRSFFAISSTRQGLIFYSPV